MSNRLFQGVIHQMAGAVDRTFGVIDSSSVIIACSELGKIGETNKSVAPESFATPSVFVINGYTFKSFGNRPNPEYAVFVSGTDEISQGYATMLAVTLNSIKEYYDEKYDKNNFMKNVVLDNILPGDIEIKGKELKVDLQATRVCFLIKTTSRTDASVYNIVQSLFPNKEKDFVISVNETDTVLVKEIGIDIVDKDLQSLAKSISDTLANEYYIQCVVGIGMVVNDIKEVPRSFKTAEVALQVGKVFQSEREIVSYECLGIARLIYQLPTTLCDMFLREVFRKGSMESLDQETLYTVQKFFENNLNVSETSRKLFIHRNTLVYRLEKIRKLTGLDLREFEDAIVFRVALMVKKYLSLSSSRY